MKIFSTAQLKAIDGATVKEENITTLELMERAAKKVAEVITKRWDNSWKPVILAGPGNNGGDALAVARLLILNGYTVKTFLFNISGNLSPECETNRERLKATEGADLVEVTTKFEAPELSENSLIIDGLFGTGVNKPLNGGFAALVKFVNASAAKVVSIDMPSGLMAEDNTYNVRNHIICADLTLTFQQPKLSQLLVDNQEFLGELQILDIGLSKEYMKLAETDFEITEPETMASILKQRDIFGHKGTFGHALIIGGKHGMAGAAVLAARACLRSGVGKVTVHTPRNNNDILQIAVPEAVLSLDKNEERFTSTIKTDGFESLAIGPGIGTEHDTAVSFIEQVRHARIPLVIDADGINILCDHKGWIQQIPSDTIFTPHPGEFKRFGNHSVDPYSSLMEAKEMAVKHSFFIILKGHYTAVCTPEGKVYFNPTGNNGMATAGSGDVLTGLLSGFLAQHYPVKDACRLAVYLHGLAGDIAVETTEEECLTATDIIENLPKAFKYLKNLRS